MRLIIKFICYLFCVFSCSLQAEDSFQESDLSFASTASRLPTPINGSVCTITGELVDSHNATGCPAEEWASL